MMVSSSEEVVSPRLISLEIESIQAVYLELGRLMIRRRVS